ncbi:MAG: prolyl oligopeptidase family serine peptidase [Lachnospiraceae bacterium]|nr:prolyl oligopeptidase family serine peptidase [Lachnospiraceae bacterium]
MLQSKGKMEIRGFDWGPNITRLIIEFAEDTDRKTELKPEMFQVTEKRKDKGFPGEIDRKVSDVYFSDEFGNKDEETPNPGFITLDLELEIFKGFPFYMEGVPVNKWSRSLCVNVSLKEGFEILLKDGKSEKMADVNISLDEGKNPDSIYLPEIKNVSLDNKFTGSKGHTFSYASYCPKSASNDNKRPLVIWIHGLGEGGNDPRICLYGNKVVSLVGEEFQKIMGGAYVLVPQCPTYWMQYKEKMEWVFDNNGQDSIYLTDLKELIDDFVLSNYVDKDRIIVGGCSNGGYMTMDLILNYPDYFAAAYPVCEAFIPDNLSYEKLAGIKNLPMWFVYAMNDGDVIPSKYEEPLLKRLKEMGCNYKLSLFEDVHDTSGKFFKDGEPLRYFGHWSWIYFFNNECFDNGISIWQWLSEQKK